MSTLRIVLACPCGARLELDADPAGLEHLGDIKSREEAWQIRHDGHIPPADPTGASSAILERFGRAASWHDERRMGTGFTMPLASAP